MHNIQADGRGVVFLSMNSATRSFNIALKANSATSGDNSGELIQSDTQANAIEIIEQQDVSAFNNAALASHCFTLPPRRSSAPTLGLICRASD